MLVAVAVIGVAIGGVAAVNAQAFDGTCEERQEQMQVRAEERLDQAIADGLITEDQADAIAEKREEMRDDRQALRDLEPEERHEAMEELRDEMHEWAEDNDIDLPQFELGQKQGFGRRMGR